VEPASSTAVTERSNGVPTVGLDVSATTENMDLADPLTSTALLDAAEVHSPTTAVTVNVYEPRAVTRSVHAMRAPALPGPINLLGEEPHAGLVTDPLLFVTK